MFRAAQFSTPNETDIYSNLYLVKLNIIKDKHSQRTHFDSNMCNEQSQPFLTLSRWKQETMKAWLPNQTDIHVTQNTIDTVCVCIFTHKYPFNIVFICLSLLSYSIVCRWTLDKNEQDFSMFFCFFFNNPLLTSAGFSWEPLKPNYFAFN